MRTVCVSQGRIEESMGVMYAKRARVKGGICQCKSKHGYWFAGFGNHAQQQIDLIIR